MSDAPRIVDFHAHVLDESALEAGRGNTVYWSSVRRDVSGPNSMFEKMLHPEVQLQDMNERGIDVNMISASTVIQGTSWAAADEELSIVQGTNDRVAEWVFQFPDRFVGSFTLPLKDVKNSLQELDRAVSSLGLRAVNLPANSEGVYVGDVRFHPLWEGFEAAGLPVFIHPDGISDPWFQRYALWNSLGQPIEDAKVMASLIYEGIPDKFPTVPIVMGHGGGFLPHYIARMDRNVANRPETTVNMTRRPSEYLKHFYYDTCVYDPSVLDALTRVVGVDRLVLGSDYPVGSTDPVGFVSSSEVVKAAGEDAFAAVVGGTASRILKLKDGLG